MDINKVTVTHKSLGIGTIYAIHGNQIEISFDGNVHTFMYPAIFQNGLTCDDAEFMSMVKPLLDKMTKQVHLQPTNVSESKSVEKTFGSIDVFSRLDKKIFDYDFISSRSGTLDIKDDAEFFEIVGYLAKPGRISSIEAQVPSVRNLDKKFESLFPNQRYRPISKDKRSAQFRIYFLDKSNCPSLLSAAIVKDSSKSIVGRLNCSRFIMVLCLCMGFKFGYEQSPALIRQRATDYGHLEDFNRGYYL